MAARVNTKFVLILFIVITTVAGTVTGIWLYKARTDATRAVQRGDEQMQLGDYRLARTMYGRAVGKDPANPEYIKKLEESLTNIQPQTTDEASELYRALVSLRKHDATHHPLDAQKHIAYLDEVRLAARRSNGWWYWELVDEGAEYMLDRLPATDPDRIVAKLYLGEARTNARMVDRLTEEEVQGGIDALREYVAARPDDESGWAGLVMALLVRAEQHRAENLVGQEELVVLEVEKTLADARSKTQEGPDLLIASLRYGLYRLLLRKESIDEAVAVSDANRLFELTEGSDDAWLVGEVVEVLDRYRWLEGAPQPIDLVDRFLESHPDAHGHLLLQARLHSFSGDLEAAEKCTKMIIDADLLPVSYVSQIQFELKRRAASLNVDIAVRRWELADPDDKAATLDGIKAARAALEALVTDPDNDPLLMRANGKIAYVEERFGEAAAIFNRLATDQASPDFEILMYAAVSLERRGEFGAATQRIEEALVLQPGNNVARLHVADLRLRMGQYEQSRDLVNVALDVEPDNEAAKSMMARIERLLNPDSAIANDPTLAALDTAQTALRAGEVESARSTISALQSETPDDLRLLNAMIRIEMAAGRTEEARRLIDQGLELAPGSRVFITLKTQLENPDPIERLRSFIPGIVEDEAERAMELVHSMRLLAINQEAAATDLEKAGSTEEAAAAREIAVKARAEVAVYRAEAERLAPDHPRFIELRFLEGIETENWDEMEAVISDATRLNSDQAGGAVYQGRYQIARGNPKDAARALSLATQRVPYSAIAWRLLALCHQRLGQSSEALAAYERSYANNPRDPNTIRAYGSMLSRTGNDQRAVSVFREGRRVAPSDTGIRDAWLEAERAIGNTAVAMLERRKIYAANPDDTRNAAALATLLGATPPSRSLLFDGNGQELVSSARWARLEAQGDGSTDAILAEARQTWHAEADAIVEKIAAPDERDIAWHALRAELLGTRGLVDEGLEVLQDYAGRQESPEGRFEATLAVGLYLSRFNRTDDALSVVAEARNLQAEGDVRADLALGDMLFEAARYEEALSSFEVVDAQTPDRNLELKIAECKIRLNQLGEARAMIDELEDSSGVDSTSLLLRATLVEQEADAFWRANRAEEAQAKVDELRDILRRAEENAPTNPMPHILQATLLLKEFQRTGDTVLLDDALRILGRADEVRPNFARTSLIRVGILKAQQDDRGAINELFALVEREPVNFDARQLLVQFLMREGRRDDAIAVAEEAVRRDPTLVIWRVGLGDLYNAMLSEARDELRRANPDSRAARTLERQIAELEAKVDTEFAEAVRLSPSEAMLIKRTATLMATDPPRYEEVMSVLEQHQARFETSPMLRMLYGEALGKSGFGERMREQMRMAYRLQRQFIDEGKQPAQSITRWYLGMRDLFGADGAESVEKMARELAGDSLDAYELFSLADIWRLRGPDGLSRSIELVKQAIQAAPEDDVVFRVEAHSDLGIFYVLLEQYPDARVTFEKVLELDPDNPEVLNNLAYLLAEKMGDPESALSYALEAAKLLPNAWNVLDTVGWIYFRLKDYENAERYLRDSEDAKNTATNQYHLAAVLAAQGDYARARRKLGEASELGPDPNTQKDINRLMDDIRTKQ